METAVLDWLARVGSSAFTYSAALFVLVNGAAVAAVVITRDRTLVNRWTGRLLAANLLLLGTGLGVPLVTAVTRLGILAVSPAQRTALPLSEQAREAQVELAPLEVRVKD